MGEKETNGINVRTKVGNYFRRVFDIHSDMMSYEEIDEMIHLLKGGKMNCPEEQVSLPVP